MSAIRQDQCADFAAGGRVRDHLNRLLEPDQVARVIIDEHTGVIVMG